MDAVSAFPTADRHAAFEYLLSRRAIYGNAFNMYNLIYSQHTQAKLFVDGKVYHVFVSTTGSNQGCVSGPITHALATIRANLEVGPGVCQVADDIHLLKQNAALQARLIAAFKRVNQVLDGPKMKTLSPANLPSRVLGGMVVHPSNTTEQIQAAIATVISRATGTYTRIIELDAPLQCKMLILRSVQWNWMFFLETWAPRAGHLLAQELDAMQTRTFYAMFPDIKRALQQEDDPLRYALLNHPIEDGGVGLIPFVELQDYMYQRSRSKTRPHAAQRFHTDIGMPNMDDFSRSRSLQGKWHQIFRETYAAARTSYVTLEGRMFCKETGFKSWLDVWPANKWLTLEDDEYTLAMMLRFRFMPAYGIVCPTVGKLDNLTPAKRFEHYFPCRQCASLMEHMRHESGVNTLHRTFNYHTTYSRKIQRGEMPVNPDEPKSATDLLVATRTLFHIDLTYTAVNEATDPSRKIHHSRKMNYKFRAKLNRYQRFEQNTGIITVPFVVAITGVIHEDTIKLIEDLITHSINPKKCRDDIMANIQMDMFRSSHAALRTTAAVRSGLITLSSAARQKSTGTTNNQQQLVPGPNEMTAERNRGGTRGTNRDNVTILDEDEMTIGEMVQHMQHMQQLQQQQEDQVPTNTRTNPNTEL